MYTTLKNSNTRITKEIIINKIHLFDGLFSLESIPYTINIEITASPDESTNDPKDINITHSINFHKVNFLFDTILNESFLVGPKTSEQLLNLFSEFDNNVILSPDLGEASLGVMLHAKLTTITKDCFVGAVEVIDNRSKVCYTYYDDENNYEYLPSITEMIIEGQMAFHELPWWYRDDISTYDGSARDEEEYNHYIENHFEKVQEAVTEPLQELESKLREAMLGGASTTGEIIDLEDFKKKTWKPKII
jgi:hypothetical protein